MDKVFENNLFESNGGKADERHVWPVDVAIDEPPPSAEALAAATDHSTTASTWLLPLLTGIAVAGIVSCGWLIGSWQNSQAQLEQQRNLLLIERLRSAAPKPMKPVEPEPEATRQPRLRESPPQQATALSLQPLTLPIQQTATLPAPETGARTTAPRSRPDEGLESPQLTGVVQGPGGSSSAIFQLGQSSFSTGIGESIGGSGWTLESISDSGAVIRSGDQQRNLSVGGVF